MSAMRTTTMENTEEIRRAERTLAAGTWTITFGAVLFSVLTVTPLVERVTPDGWGWTAPILPIVVDAAVVIVVRLDAVVSRLDGDAGRWPVALRWLTGCMTLALNIGDSALKRDWVGVAVHAVAPLLLIVTAEAGLAYRRAITQALARIDREQQERADRERADREARERRAREERQERERHEREEREREREAAERREREAREHAERLERERLEAEERRAREEREHTARLQREQWEREERRAREERERQERERLERQERERHEREEREREREAAAVREQRPARAVNTPAARPVNAETARREQPAGKAVNTGKATPAPGPVNASEDKLPEGEALEEIRQHWQNATLRQLCDRTGWSLGWVSARVRELRAAEEQRQEEPELAAA